MRSNAPSGDKIKNYISNLTKLVERGHYMDGIPSYYVRPIGRRNKYWDMMRISDKQTYLRMMAYIVKDKDVDYHIGDANFQNTIIGSRVAFENLAGKLQSKYYLNSKVINFPHKLNKRIEVNTSSFNYGKLIQHTALYMPIPGMDESRIRRYSFICPECKIAYTLGDKECVNKHKVRPNGFPKVVPYNEEAWRDTYRLMNQWERGYRKLIAMKPFQQDILIRQGIQSNTNSGWPFFTRQTENNKKTLLADFCEIIHYPLGNGDWCERDKRWLVTAKWIMDIMFWANKRQLFFPYVLFYRIQPGDGDQKHRAVFGAHVLQKYFAGMMSACYDLGYDEDAPGSFLDDVFTDKRIYGVGGLPIVAQTNWDLMFQAILHRMPDTSEDGKVIPMDSEKIGTLFHKKLAPGDYMVNVVGGDFEGFDTGQIPEDYEPLRKHKFWGPIMGVILDELNVAEVWTANKALLGIFFKSGFFGTSHFGSAFHRNFSYSLCKYYKAIILSDINLSDDDLLFVIGLSAKQVQDYAKRYGFNIRASSSYDYSEEPIVAFLKVHLGRIFNYNGKGMLGDLQSRYYGLAHSERPIELEKPVVDPNAPNIRDVWEVTGDVEVDALISKLASLGSEGGLYVRRILESVKDTDLGRKAILAISRIKPDVEYHLYRRDIEISFPPNWLSTLDVTDLLTNEKSLQ